LAVQQEKALVMDVLPAQPFKIPDTLPVGGPERFPVGVSERVAHRFFSLYGTFGGEYRRIRYGGDVLSS
jgi:hypothetical protein